MAWIAITTAFVKTKLTGVELTALQTAALASGQSDPLPEVIEQIVNEVRGYIQACSNNTLEDGSKIPDRLLNAALARIRFDLATRLPDSGLLDQDRRDANDRAVRLLEQVAACKFAIEEPTVEDTEVAASPRPSIQEPENNFDEASQDGI